MNRPFRITVYIVLFVIIGYSLNAGFSFLYLCSPIKRLWDTSVSGTCVDLNAAYLVSSVLNAVTDVVILLLPIWLLWPLRVRWEQKMVVALALMPGGLYVYFCAFFPHWDFLDSPYCLTKSRADEYVDKANEPRY